MPRKSSRVFDFDDWLALARDDPDGFEQRRKRRIDELIARANPAQRRRLRGLQFRIDMERRRARTPMAACVRIQTWMWDSLIGPDGFYERLLSSGCLARGRPGPVRDHGSESRESHSASAVVIPFPARRHPAE